ncbi:NAD(P)H-binding protein [Nocardia niwae]|uniref:NAD(P)H-binding protein n=2 Tax=Nocardia niwae TaxID=626084 RepID=A0ABV2XCJ3_9NOCA
MPKIVLFGATGYTGRLTAEALFARGAAPVLAARNATALQKLAADLGGAETAVADVTDPGSVRALVGRGDVLVTTVGPFLRYGGPALAAAPAHPWPGCCSSTASPCAVAGWCPSGPVHGFAGARGRPDVLAVEGLGGPRGRAAREFRIAVIAIVL